MHTFLKDIYLIRDVCSLKGNKNHKLFFHFFYNFSKLVSSASYEKVSIISLSKRHNDDVGPSEVKL